jgi:hypothetical protein
MNHFVPASSIRPIAELLQSREHLLAQIVAKLKARDLRDDNSFKRLKRSIRRTVLLQPVEFGAPTISGHPDCAEEVPLWRRVIARVRHLFTKVVTFPFTGSKELFCYTPEPDIIDGTESGIFEPMGNCLPVDVGLPFEDEAQVLKEASIMVTLTRQFIAINNSIVSSWRKRISRRIEETLDAKRREAVMAMPSNGSGRQGMHY